MSYRKQIDTTEELAAWYNEKYRQMGGCWNTPADEHNRHLDDLGVPFSKSKWLLDVGCGDGSFIAQAQRRVSGVGWEISEQAISFAEEKNPQARIQKVAIDGDLRWLKIGMFDYITSLGSLEHVIDLDAALANIRRLLKPDGKWYFYVPNEKWKHFDQPNERTHTEEEWVRIFAAGGLEMHDHRRWNDSTAFWGGKADVDP
jgi:2-polyprenyl-3-methyl-5-hydroxy-6-metoxy-1,4-benzoquinol methylase